MLHLLHVRLHHTSLLFCSPKLYNVHSDSWHHHRKVRKQIRLWGLFSQWCRQAPISWEVMGCSSHCAWWWQMEGGEWSWKMKAGMERSRHAGGGQAWKRDAFPVCLMRSWCSGWSDKDQRESGGREKYLPPSYRWRLYLWQPHYTCICCCLKCWDYFFHSHTYCFRHIWLNWRSNSWDSSAAQ